MAADREPPRHLPRDEATPLTRRERRGTRAGKVRSHTGRGVVPLPRQYSTRRRG